MEIMVLSGSCRKLIFRFGGSQNFTRLFPAPGKHGTPRFHPEWSDRNPRGLWSNFQREDPRNGSGPATFDRPCDEKIRRSCKEQKQKQKNWRPGRKSSLQTGRDFVPKFGTKIRHSCYQMHSCSFRHDTGQLCGISNEIELRRISLDQAWRFRNVLSTFCFTCSLRSVAHAIFLRFDAVNLEARHRWAHVPHSQD